jgi:hypothetical protein
LSNTRQDVRDQAESRFRKMEQRASDAAKARTEYEIAAQGVDEKTARLKALRLAKACDAKSAAEFGSANKQRRSRNDVNRAAR